jgi:hypothetical protein
MLRRAAVAIYDIPRIDNEWGTSTSQLLRGQLSEKWCKSDAALMMEDLQIGGHYYLAASASPSEEYLKAHSKCCEDRCTAEVEKGTYVTRHAPGCKQTTCETDTCYGSDGFASVGEPPGNFLDAILGIIDRRGTPIIIWDERDHKVTTREYNVKRDMKPKCVAVSHV